MTKLKQAIVAAWKRIRSLFEIGAPAPPPPPGHGH
jgi:hypothetical protein